jgi:microsomal dipeptidase-like Zn-dependent dipeptidase
MRRAIERPHLPSKERAKIVGDTAGVIGVRTKLVDSAQEFAENIKAMADTVGIDHVGIVTDMDLLSSRVGYSIFDSALYRFLLTGNRARSVNGLRGAT